MKTAPQTRDALTHLADRLKDHRVAMLTLAEPGVGLTSRPMTPLEMDGDGAIWFIGSHHVLDRLIGAPDTAVNLNFVREADGDYLSICGSAALVDDLARKEALWTLAARPWFEGPADPDLALIRVAPRQAEVWDGPDNAVTRVLAMTASVISGREVGMGTKETIDVPGTPTRELPRT